jgi:ferritin
MEEKVRPPEFFKSIKTTLKSILKRPEITTTKINDVVIKAHKIVIHTLQFLKLYLLHHYDENHQRLPIIDKKLVNTVMKVMCGVNEEKKRKTS